MKQSLQLRIGQSLTMTPQLQQAIKLLQMSTLDLHEEIERTLEENPLLEREEELEHYQPNPASLRSGPTDKPFTRDQHQILLETFRELREMYPASELSVMFDVYIQRVLHS